MKRREFLKLLAGATIIPYVSVEANKVDGDYIGWVHPDAIGEIGRYEGFSFIESDPFEQIASVNWKAWHTGKAMNENLEQFSHDWRRRY